MSEFNARSGVRTFARFLCLYKEYQCRGFSEQQSTQILSGTRTTHTNSQFTIPLAERERERERERGLLEQQSTQTLSSHFP